MKKIILDTNAVIDMADFKIDLFSELHRILDIPYQVCILRGTIQELEKIMQSQRLRFARAAKMGLAILQLKKVKILSGIGNVDDMLVQYSAQGALVLTQDRELKRRLTRPYLTIRQKKTVMMIGMIEIFSG